MHGGMESGVDRESAVSVLITALDEACQQNTADYK